MLKSVTIKGFKSIRLLKEFKLNPLNVLIGNNGAGKSNFLEAILMLNLSATNDLNHYINQQGANRMLYYGKKRAILKYIAKGNYRYEMHIDRLDRLDNAKADDLFDDDGVYIGKNLRLCHEIYNFENVLPSADYLKNDTGLITNDKLTKLCSLAQNIAYFNMGKVTKDSVLNFLKEHNNRYRLWIDSPYIFPDCRNVIGVLHNLKEKYPKDYESIMHHAKTHLGNFGGFIFNKIDSFGWYESNTLTPDVLYSFEVMSDDSFRFICLLTILLQPIHRMPNIIMIDGIEKGIHPKSMCIIGALLKRATEAGRQIFITTQSQMLLDYFDYKDLIIVSKEKEFGSPELRSTYKRLDIKAFKGVLGNDARPSCLLETDALGGFLK